MFDLCLQSEMPPSKPSRCLRVKMHLHAVLGSARKLVDHETSPQEEVAPSRQNCSSHCISSFPLAHDRLVHHAWCCWRGGGPGAGRLACRHLVRLGKQYLSFMLLFNIMPCKSAASCDRAVHGLCM
jgi:hypothetical protein